MIYAIEVHTLEGDETCQGGKARPSGGRWHESVLKAPVNGAPTLCVHICADERIAPDSSTARIVRGLVILLSGPETASETAGVAAAAAMAQPAAGFVGSKHHVVIFHDPVLGGSCTDSGDNHSDDCRNRGTWTGDCTQDDNQFACKHQV